MLNLAPSAGEKLSLSINGLIDYALQQENALQKRRNYLGASRLGEECMRKLWFEHHEPMRARLFPGRILRRFRLGHMHEAETADWLLAAGFKPQVVDHNGEQMGFMDGDAPIGGHCDGVIHAGPIVLPYPLLWEHKIMKASSWNKFVKEGVERANYTYYAQCVIYMEKLGLTHCLFTALNSDTSELRFELIPNNAGMARSLLERGRKIVTASNEHDMPRVAPIETDFRCRWCSFKEHCWRPDDRVAKPIPSVLPSWAKR